MLSSACAAGSSSRAPAQRVDLTVITQEQLREHQFRNAFEAVATLRSNWLQTRGTDSFTNPTQVVVYYDDVRLGGIETLRNLGTASIAYIRYYDGLAATARWGIGHGQGVIYVSTFPR